MSDSVRIGNRRVGAGEPTFIVGEIGINHNGDVELARRLIQVAASAGCDAVKFQKRTPELATPPQMRDVVRETPWGAMTYLEYRKRVEFGEREYRLIDEYCREAGIQWFASCWDVPSLEFMEQFDPPCYKVASASITDPALMRATAALGRTVVLSTGMSTIEEIDEAVSYFERDRLLIAHTTSTYPCPPEQLNLRMIQTLRDRYRVPVGYSGHEVGLQTTYAAVALGACFVERHITLDRAMWGSDQAASVEPPGLARLVRDIRVIEAAMGDGVKQVYADELTARRRLRPMIDRAAEI